jgi:hypothetical protein
MTPPEIDISPCREVPAAVIRKGMHRVFVNRLRRAKDHVRRIVVISPWITPVPEAHCPLSVLVDLIRLQRIPAYFFTRRPQNPNHTSAVQLLQSCPTVELIYNENIHAKVYACVAASPHGFGLLGSANLTANSLNLYEIALVVRGVGRGSAIVEDLAKFGLERLRTRPESEVVKKIDVRSLRNVLQKYPA